jgi:hypothetical protein
MLWTPLDFLRLVGVLASSKPATEAERNRLVSTLENLRAGLVSAVSGSSTVDTESGRRQFSNAASDFFCQVKLLAASPRHDYAELEGLASFIECVLNDLRRSNSSGPGAKHLLTLLDAEIARLTSQGPRADAAA